MQLLIKRDVTRIEYSMDLTPEQLNQARRLIDQVVIPYDFEGICFESEGQIYEQNYQQATQEELVRIKKLEKSIAQSSKSYEDSDKHLSR